MKIIAQWSAIISLFAGSFIAYGSLNKEVNINTKNIDNINIKLDRIYGDVQIIKGFLDK